MLQLKWAGLHSKLVGRRRLLTLLAEHNPSLEVHLGVLLTSTGPQRVRLGKKNERRVRLVATCGTAHPAAAAAAADQISLKNHKKAKALIKGNISC